MIGRTDLGEDGGIFETPRLLLSFRHLSIDQLSTFLLLAGMAHFEITSVALRVHTYIDH